MLDTELLQHIHLFDDLDEQQRQTIAAHSQLVSLQEHQHLFTQGDHAEYFYYVHSGQIKLFRLSSAGDEKVFEIVTPGQIFAEAVIFSTQRQYPVNAEALISTGLYAFHIPSFTSILHDSTDSCFRLLSDLSRRMFLRINEIDALTLQNAAFRLVYFLLQQIPEGAICHSSIHLTTPKNVIASRLSIQPETLSRILSTLKKKNLIKVKGHNITLLDVKGMRNFLHS